MKSLKEISDEFIKKHKPFHIYDGKDDFWDFYLCISGVINGSLFSICFSQNQDTIKIQLESSTKNPLKMTKIIKTIEPKAKVTYYQTETIQKEITI